MPHTNFPLHKHLHSHICKPQKLFMATTKNSTFLINKRLFFETFACFAFFTEIFLFLFQSHSPLCSIKRKQKSFQQNSTNHLQSNFQKLPYQKYITGRHIHTYNISRYEKRIGDSLLSTPPLPISNIKNIVSLQRNNYQSTS